MTPLRAAVRVSAANVAWGSVTGALSLVAGARSASLSLVGAGCAILADVVGSSMLVWRFRLELRGAEAPAPAERRAQLVISIGLLLVAAGLAVSSVARLLEGAGASPDAFAVTLAAVSLVALPVFAALKYRLAAAVPSRALRTDAHTTVVGAATAAATLLGLAATSAFGWTAADAIAALVIAAAAGWVGAAALRRP